MSSNPGTLSPKSARHWAMAACLIAGAFFSVGFALRVSPGVMVEHLMRDFGVTALLLGNLSAFYFYPYGALQIPIGLWLDRFGLRWSMTLACAVAAIGCFVFASSEVVQSAYLGRFLIGAGCAFSWPGYLAIIHRWFPGRFAVLAGVGQVLGMCGAILGQAPLAGWVANHGWRSALFGGALCCLCLSVLLAISIRDPRARSHEARVSVPSPRVVLGNRQTWLAALYGMSLAAQLLVFGGLWGVPYLKLAYSISSSAAGGMVSMLFVGAGLSSIVVGWWSDRSGCRRRPMLISGVVGLGAGVMVIGLPIWSTFTVHIWMLAMGVGGGGIGLAFAVCREHNPYNASGLAVGVVNTAVIGSGALIQPLVGFLLDSAWSGQMSAGLRVYDVLDYRIALSILPLLSLSGLVAVLIMKEPQRGGA